MRWTASFVLVCAFGLNVASAKVCSPTWCIEGKSSSPLLVHDNASRNDFAPGAYSASSDIDISSFAPSAQLNQSGITIGSSLVISPPPHPVAFSDTSYKGKIAVVTSDIRSLFLPPGYYGLVGPGMAVWGAVPDMKQLGGSSRLASFGLATCDPPCASEGECVEDTATKGKCQCSEGWTGAACDQCATGHFGPACKACAGDCSICDQGISGTGKCLGTANTPLKDCNCAHGSCAASGDCTCAAGYTTNSTASGTKCADCAAGFFKAAQGDCLACPLGCASCALKDGTNDTATCTSCVATLQLNTADPARCVSAGTCNAGQYLDASTSTCQGCSPACATCTGPSTSECLSCALPRVNLAGNCVGFHASTGVCASDLSGLQGVFVVNNAKSRCDACPVGCASCRLPGFSSASDFSTATCDSCQDGYLMQNGKCVQTCSEGWFLPQAAVKNGTCQRCDASCVDCIGSSTTCTKCAAPSFASNGACISLCPSNTVASNGTCIPCSPDCLTCSYPSSSSCVTCPSNRPILANGRCIEYCSAGTYFDKASNGCKSCNSSCGSCLGSGPSKCSSCPNGSVLRNGKCDQRLCKHGELDGMGVCLENLIAKNNHKNLGFIALIVLFALLGVGVWWCVERQRQRTRMATQEFANAMDDKDVRDRMMILRLERVLGLDRVRQKPIERLAEEGDRKARDRVNLRELLMVSRKGKGRDDTDKKRSPGARKDRAESETTGKGVKKQEMGGARESWSVPPPPYFAPGASSSNLSTITASTTSEGEKKAFPPLKTKFISMTSTSPLSPMFNLGGLRPPPRSSPSSSSVETRGPDVKAPLGQNGEGREVKSSSLARLWPAMGTPGFGDAQARRQEAWI